MDASHMPRYADELYRFSVICARETAEQPQGCLACQALRRTQHAESQSTRHSACFSPAGSRVSPRSIRLDDFPVPDEHRLRHVVVRHREEFTLSSRMTRLKVHIWTPSEPRALVLAVHDFGFSHATRVSRHMVPELLTSHIGVVAFDLCGHGESDRRPPTSSNPDEEAQVIMDEWVNDVHAVIQNVIRGNAQIAGLPLVLYGDGLGATMLLQYGLERSDMELQEINVRGFLCSATLLSDCLTRFRSPPLLHMERSAMRPPTAASLSGFMSDLVSTIAGELGCFSTTYVSTMAAGLEPENLDNLARDLRVGEMIRNDPCRIRCVPEAVEVAAKRLIQSVECGSRFWKHPLVLMHGERDQFSSLEAVETFSKESQSALHVFTDCGHWLHHEILPSRDEFLREVRSCVERLASVAVYE